MNFQKLNDLNGPMRFYDTNRMEFSLNVFTEFAEFSDKNFLKNKNEQCGAGTQDLLCKRQE